MFGFNKKEDRPFEVVAPISGKIINIEEVNDQVFATKMMGDGFAVTPDQLTNTIVAPMDGEITAIAGSGHAVGIKNEKTGVEMMVHVGLDTVKLKGRGFKVLVKMGKEVSAGDKMIAIDWQIMDEEKLDMTTIVVFTDGYSDAIDLKDILGVNVQAGQTIIK